MPTSATGAPVRLDDLDHLLVTALQTAPRADWRRIGAALGVDGSTAARRWARLTGAGLAWLTCFPLHVGDQTWLSAFVEVDCAPGRLHEVAAALVEDPNVFNLEHVTGGRDLLLTLVCRDQAELARYVGFRLGRLPGVAATRTQIATTLHAEGSRWRLDRLNEEQRRILLGDGPNRPAEPRPMRPGDLELARVLAQDCRASVAELAARTGLSPSTVRRRLARMEADGGLAFRCEVARDLSGWPVAAYLWLSAPAGEAARIVALLAGLRETRLCASLTGADNLLVNVWLRSMDGIHAVEQALVRRFPELRVTDRTVTLWPVKMAGQLLDPHGRWLRAVPVWLWDDPTTEAELGALLGRLRTGTLPDA
ncbi:Lrp/AsnC family transcriptional regulator [Actinomadura rupiterrae]|uniref:Lrp/AsnC family transcriptional regulator n=1 Tax=Actinomadura rupiterrae TaxID=559627 RepID=UPI0020A304A2|nr:Lrp/AsnC family transcriptional regulator [Actinomadura rupiterrae]MCP2338607.1 DNA-binding Lrp family transcriptional regulator [Actinomadura rupiterrae]